MGLILYSSTTERISGKVGTNVYTSGRSGATVRIKARVRNPRTGPQQGVRRNLDYASTAYKNLTASEAQAWKQYAGGQTKHNKLSGQAYTPSAMNVFVELATKFLQVNPTGTIPITPPAQKFAGDAVTLSASVSAGTLTLTATGPNTAGVTTEILLQPLPSLNREPSANAYRHNQFVAFASGSLSVDIEVPAGHYAAAYRFVKIATGQATPLVPLAVQTVPLSLTGSGEGKAKKAA